MIHFLSTAKTRKYWCKELNKLSESHPARVSMEFQPSLGTYCAQIKLCAPVPVGLGLHLHSSHSLHRRRRRRPLSASMICASALVISYWISCYRLLFVICYLEIQSFFGHPFLNDLAPWKCISHRHFSLMLIFYIATKILLNLDVAFLFTARADSDNYPWGTNNNPKSSW